MLDLSAISRGWPDSVQSWGTAVAFPSLTWFHVSYYTPDVRSVDGQSGPKAVLSLQHD